MCIHISYTYNVYCICHDLIKYFGRGVQWFYLKKNFKAGFLKHLNKILHNFLVCMYKEFKIFKRGKKKFPNFAQLKDVLYLILWNK